MSGQLSTALSTVCSRFSGTSSWRARVFRSSGCTECREGGRTGLPEVAALLPMIFLLNFSAAVAEAAAVAVVVVIVVVVVVVVEKDAAEIDSGCDVVRRMIAVCEKRCAVGQGITKQAKAGRKR